MTEELQIPKGLARQVYMFVGAEEDLLQDFRRTVYVGMAGGRVDILGGARRQQQSYVSRRPRRLSPRDYQEARSQKP
jgi:hypothetical protein